MTDKVRGLDIVVVIKALNKDHAFALLEKMNFPFIKKGQLNMAKVSAVNKNDKELNYLINFTKKDKV